MGKTGWLNAWIKATWLFLTVEGLELSSTRIVNYEPVCSRIPQTLFTAFDLQMMPGHLPTRLFSHCASILMCPVNSHESLCQNKPTHGPQPISKELVSWEQRRLPVWLCLSPASLLGHFPSLSASTESQTCSLRQNNLIGS